jgi:hypothetical protein
VQYYTATSEVRTTHRFIILSPTLLLDSRPMLSPSDSNLSLSLLADRRCEVGLSVVGVPSFDACCTCTTGMGGPRFTNDSALSEPMAGRMRSMFFVVSADSEATR